MVFTSLVSFTHTLLRRGGRKALIAENLILKQQLFLLTRSRQRAPKLSPLERFLLGLWTIFLDPRRIKRTAIPPTLHTPAVSSGVDRMEISPALLFSEKREAGSEGTFSSTPCTRTGNETTPSAMWVHQNCRADSQALCQTPG